MIHSLLKQHFKWWHYCLPGSLNNTFHAKIIDSFEAAIWCLITTDSYKECMLKAVNLGDDTDTVAAIAGGFAGLYYGYEAIPQEWLAVIKRKEWIEDLCRQAEMEF